MKTEWIHTVQSLIQQSSEIPMWGQIPSFPWENFSHTLKEFLQINSVSLQMSRVEWVNESHLLSGLGDNPLIFSFVLSPLNPPFFLSLAKEDLHQLTEAFLRHENNAKSFDNIDYQKGFFRYFLLKTLDYLNHLKVYEGLSIKMHDAPLPKEKSYRVNVILTLDERDQIPLNLIFPSGFHQVLLSHFIKKPLILSHVKQDLDLPFAIKAGHVKLNLDELKSIKTGDFVILDTCSYHINERQGPLTLTLYQTPLFIVKSKGDQLKILDFALFEEDTMMMDNEEFDEENLEDEEFEDEDIEEQVDSKKQKVSRSDTLEPMIRSRDIPLTIHVEVAHLKMSLKELLSLQPGNTLDLKTRPEAGVQLTINGKVVGRGELLQIGDLLGVKITALVGS